MGSQWTHSRHILRLVDRSHAVSKTPERRIDAPRDVDGLAADLDEAYTTKVLLAVHRLDCAHCGQNRQYWLPRATSSKQSSSRYLEMCGYV